MLDSVFLGSRKTLSMVVHNSFPNSSRCVVLRCNPCQHRVQVQELEKVSGFDLIIVLETQRHTGTQGHRDSKRLSLRGTETQTGTLRAASGNGRSTLSSPWSGPQKEASTVYADLRANR
eukprot:406914-Rhodomonas_salina.7